MQIIYAPNVRAGGGLVLLRALLSSWKGPPRLHAILDSRAQSKVSLPADADVHWVDAGLLGRMNAEWMLQRAARDAASILCFHGLPPVMAIDRSGPRVTVFVQNRLVVKRSPLGNYPLKVRLRIVLERFLFRSRISRVDDIIVQGQGMQRELAAFLGAGTQLPRIHVRPFAAPISFGLAKSVKCFDFIYPASGDAHKNHVKLIEAWEGLRQEGFTPSLALTLGAHDRPLWDMIDARVRSASLNIVNLGSVDRDAIVEAYGHAKALIFPSITESFGLPLIEAASVGLPIVAGELDFVRDVCEPAESFDPTSAVSIARAVKRFLKQPGKRDDIVSPEAFWVALMSDQTRP